MPEHVEDVDGIGDRRRGTVSLFGGPAPVVFRGEDEAAEDGHVSAWSKGLLEKGFAPGEIGPFVVCPDDIERAWNDKFGR